MPASGSDDPVRRSPTGPALGLLLRLVGGHLDGLVRGRLVCGELESRPRLRASAVGRDGFASASSASASSARQGRLLHRRELRVVDPALLDAGLLPTQLAEVVELGPADLSSRDHLEPGDRGRVHREGPLHADAERDLADGERLAQAAVLTADHHALEHLNPLATPLHHPHVHLDGVAWAEVRDVRAQIGCSTRSVLFMTTVADCTSGAFRGRMSRSGHRRAREGNPLGAIIFAVVVAAHRDRHRLPVLLPTPAMARTRIRVDLAIREHLDVAQVRRTSGRSWARHSLARTAAPTSTTRSWNGSISRGSAPSSRPTSSSKLVPPAVGQRLRHGGQSPRDALLPARALGGAICSL